MAKIFSASEVADHFLDLGRQHGRISHLKLQKLLYFAQGYYLAKTGVPLFADPIQAWKFGPVIQEIYHEYKRFGNLAIDLDGAPLATDDPSVPAFLRSVWNTFVKFSAIKLSEISHLPNGPWHKVVMANGGDVGAGLEIPPEYMRDYFSKLLKH